MKQLAGYAKRLDGTVHDLSNADKLVDGTIELKVRKVDLEAIVSRVVSSSDLSERPRGPRPDGTGRAPRRPHADRADPLDAPPERG